MENDNDEPEFLAVSYSVLHIAPSLPVQFSLRLSFSRNRVLVGQNSFEQPLRLVHASEAAEHLRAVLEQMPPLAEGEVRDQQKAMVCAFLGDALIALGEQTEARVFWAQAIALDPPPALFPGWPRESWTSIPPDCGVLTWAGTSAPTLPPGPARRRHPARRPATPFTPDTRRQTAEPPARTSGCRSSPPTPRRTPHALSSPARSPSP